jgi:hypothetical protein
MSASAQTVNGVSYTYASGSQTVPAGRVAGSYSASITASDRATPVNTSAAYPFTVVVDNTAPSATAVAITNASGPTGVPSSGDTITYTWNETIDPWSLGLGWNGSGSQVVTVKITNRNKGQGGDYVTIWDANNSVQLPLGSLGLGDTGYVSSGGGGSATFGGPGNSTRSTITWNGTSFTVTLGPKDPTGSTLGTPGGTSTATWTPASGAFDRAGNPSGTATATDGTTSYKF